MTYVQFTTTLTDFPDSVFPGGIRTPESSNPEADAMTMYITFKQIICVQTFAPKIHFQKWNDGGGLKSAP
jgi:hypothetical protein